MTVLKDHQRAYVRGRLRCRPAGRVAESRDLGDGRQFHTGSRGRPSVPIRSRRIERVWTHDNTARRARRTTSPRAAKHNPLNMPQLLDHARLLRAGWQAGDPTQHLHGVVLDKGDVVGEGLDDCWRVTWVLPTCMRLVCATRSRTSITTLISAIRRQAQCSTWANWLESLPYWAAFQHDAAPLLSVR